MANTLAEADRMLAARDATGTRLRVQENFIFYPPLVRLKEIVESGEIGEPRGLYMKMTGTGVGGWEVPISTWMWQIEQTASGRGILMFDDGWHKFSVARWLFGEVAEVQAMIGATRAHPDFEIYMDAPSAVMWRHTNDVQGVFEINLAPDMVMPSDYYTNDERFEVTGTKGFVRVNHCTSRGLQAPSLEVYRDGELRQYHALDDDWGSSFRDQTRHALAVFRSGEGDLLWDGDDARAVLAFNLAAIHAGRSRRPVDVAAFSRDHLGDP
jgi:predicted dehydrogenase